MKTLKIIIGALAAECNSFATDPGDFARWAGPNGCSIGQEIFDRFRGSTSAQASGIIKAGDEDPDVTMIPTISLCCSAPVLKREAVDHAADIICDAIRANPDADGACFWFHGSGISEDMEDIETYILRRMHAAAGRRLPISLLCDLHGNIKQDMLNEVDCGVFAIKEYPHIDKTAVGYLAMKTLIRALRGECTITTALAPIPLMIPCCIGCTLEPPMQAFKEHMKEYQEAHGVLDVSFFHGFPYSDVYESRASIVVNGEHGEDVQAMADELAHWVWDHRHALDVECLDAEEAMDRAEAEAAKPGGGYVLIHEASDNAGGGCPNDGTGMLRELLRRNEPGTILGYIHDEEIALAACAAGIGGKISGLLGGKTDNRHGAPVEIRDAVVCALSDGEAIYTAPPRFGQHVSYGKTARLRIGNAEVVVTEKMSNQTFDDRPFLITGADIEQYRIVVIKSATHFRGFFLPRAKAIVTANTPGNCTANFHQLPYERIKRPIYPLDPDTTF